MISLFFFAAAHQPRAIYPSPPRHPLGGAAAQGETHAHTCASSFDFGACFFTARPPFTHSTGAALVHTSGGSRTACTFESTEGKTNASGAFLAGARLPDQGALLAALGPPRPALFSSVLSPRPHARLARPAHAGHSGGDGRGPGPAAQHHGRAGRLLLRAGDGRGVDGSRAWVMHTTWHAHRVARGGGRAEA